MTEQLSNGGAPAAGTVASRPHSLPPSPRSLLPRPVAEVYDRYHGAGMKANLKNEMRKLASHFSIISVKLRIFIRLHIEQVENSVIISGLHSNEMRKCRICPGFL